MVKKNEKSKKSGKATPEKAAKAGKAVKSGKVAEAVKAGKAGKAGKAAKSGKAAKAAKAAKAVKAVKTTKVKPEKEGKNLPGAISRARAYRQFEASVDGDGVPNVNKAFDLSGEAPEKLSKEHMNGKSIPARALYQHLNATVFAQVLGAPLRSKQAQLAIDGLFDQLLSIAAKGGKIRIPNLFMLQKKHRPARKGRNPATGETIKIAAKTVVNLRAIKAAKDYVLANG
jgi:DNA-binding protein HU-beta